jgi:hypothetical protein
MACCIAGNRESHAAERDEVSFVHCGFLSLRVNKNPPTLPSERDHPKRERDGVTQQRSSDVGNHHLD